LHHGREANTGGPSITANLQPQRGQLLDILNTTPSPMHSSWSHNHPQHQLPLLPLPSTPEPTFAPLLPTHAPQMVQPLPSSFVPKLVPLLQPIPNSLHDLPPPQDLNFKDYQSSHNIVQPPQNYTSPNSAVEHSFEATPTIINCSVDNFFVDDMVGYDQWGFPMSDHAFNNVFLYMDAFLGYNGIK
jgi:hypothetical protein